MTKTRTTGFTLIELLIVVAIIAILAAILFPVFSRARQNARKAACQSNLKQIGLGMLQYSQDYDEKLPVSGETGYNGLYGNGFGVTPGVQYASWRQKIYSYTGAGDIYRCPTNPMSAQVCDLAVTGVYPAINKGYLINPNLYSSAYFPAGFAIARLTNPASRLMIIDGENSVDQAAYVYFDPRQDAGTCKTRSSRGHLGTFNVLYADGHVKAMNAIATAKPVNQWGYLGDINNEAVDANTTGCMTGLHEQFNS